MEQNKSSNSPRPPQLDWTTSGFSQSNNRFPPEVDEATKVEAEDHNSAPAPNPGSDVIPHFLGRMHMENSEDSGLTPPKLPLQVGRVDEEYSQDKRNEEVIGLSIENLPTVSGAARQSLHSTESIHSITNMHGNHKARQKAAEVDSEDDLAVIIGAQQEAEDDDWKGPDIPESIKLFIAEKKVQGGSESAVSVARQDEPAFSLMDERSVTEHKKTTHWDTAEDRVTRHRSEWKSSTLSHNSSTYLSSAETTSEVKTEDRSVGQSAGKSKTDAPPPPSVRSRSEDSTATSKQKTALLSKVVPAARSPISAAPAPALSATSSTRPPPILRRPVSRSLTTAVEKSGSNPVAQRSPHRGISEKEIAKFALGVTAWAFSVGAAVDDHWLEDYTVKAGRQDFGECYGNDGSQSVSATFCTQFLMFSVMQILATVMCSMGVLQLLFSFCRGIVPGDRWARRSLLLFAGITFSFSAILQGAALGLASSMIPDGSADRGATFWVGWFAAIMAVLVGLLLVCRPSARNPHASRQPLRGDEIMEPQHVI